MGVESFSGAQWGTAGQAAGVALQSYASYKKASGEQQGYEYQSAVARNNAQLAEWQAQDAITRGGTAKNNVQLKAAQVSGSQRAIIASRNVALNEGSALNLLTDTELMAARDQSTIEDNANREAWALREQARGYMSNAQMMDYRAANTNPWLEAGGTALAGAGRVARSWYKTDPSSQSGGYTGPSNYPSLLD